MAIFGLARSGMSALKFIASKTGHECFAVNQGEPETWDSFHKVVSLIPRKNCYSEEDALDLFSEVDVIIKSPGIPFSHPALSKAREKRVEIISEIEFAFRFSDIPVIAITGTNGKTTTATMTAELLSSLGQNVFLGGNIGIPYSEVLMDDKAYDWAVVEVSSFQLENIKNFAPKVAILTNISPSHGERYDSHELYRDAKLKLFQNMGKGEIALLPYSLMELNLPCKKVEIRALDNGIDYTRSLLAGKHNRENLFCAYQACLSILGEPELVSEATQKYVDGFSGVSYRNQFICKARDLEIYNDGKSTNMASTLAAIDTFEDKPIYLILGGKLRDLEMDFCELVTKNISKIYAFGEARDFIAKKVFEQSESGITVDVCSNLEEVFELIKEQKPKGALLFSPAFPSFDLYKDYEERAEAFNSLARGL